MLLYHDYFLALFFTFVAVFYWVRIVFFNRTSSPKLVFSDPRFSKQWFTHTTFKAFRALIWFLCVLRLWLPETDNWIGVCPFLYRTEVLLFGDMLLIVGFSLVLTAHKQMQGAWRSGINASEKLPLITSGLFSISRNPIFIGVIIAQVGFFLALPSVFSFICLVVGVSMLLVQEHEEERNLLTHHGNAYEDYRNEVPRWLIKHSTPELK